MILWSQHVKPFLPSFGVCRLSTVVYKLFIF